MNEMVVKLDSSVITENKNLFLKKTEYKDELTHQHRAVNSIHINKQHILLSVLLAVTVTLLLYWLNPEINIFWENVLSYFLTPIISNLHIYTGAIDIFGKQFIYFPVVDFPAQPPSWDTWIILNGLTTSALLLSILFDKKLLPISYLIRLICIMQFASNFYFYFMPEMYPYGMEEHTATYNSGAYVFVLTIPLVLFLTYYVLNYNLLFNAICTFVILTYFIVLAPILLATQVVLINFLSIAVQPVLLLMFSIPLFVYAFVGLYGVAMSLGDRK
jgi:hypothetical protein